MTDYIAPLQCVYIEESQRKKLDFICSYLELGQIMDQLFLMYLLQ